jgi:hypothetical protein
MVWVSVNSVLAELKVRYEYCHSERRGRVEGEAWVNAHSVLAESQVRHGSAFIASQSSLKIS